MQMDGGTSSWITERVLNGVRDVEHSDDRFNISIERVPKEL